MRAALPIKYATTKTMVVFDDPPRRRTMKVVNHEEFKNLLSYVRRYQSHVVEVGESINILLLQGRLQHDNLLLMEKELSRGRRKEDAAATQQVVRC